MVKAKKFLLQKITRTIGTCWHSCSNKNSTRSILWLTGMKRWSACSEKMYRSG
jgi:hypothetical protein